MAFFFVLAMHNLSILLQAELAGTSEEASLSTSVEDFFNMEHDDMYQFP